MGQGQVQLLGAGLDCAVCGVKEMQDAEYLTLNVDWT